MSGAYEYVAYVDEAGDDGLRRVRPHDPKGSSEWLILSAVLVRAENEANTADWISEIINALPKHQGRGLHFARLRSDAAKRQICDHLAGLPARCFVVCSNKKNMAGYRNERAERVPSKNQFYNWMMRLLLERVTHYVDRRSRRDHGGPRKVRIDLSARGGQSYPGMTAYLRYLHCQGTNTYQRDGRLYWDVVDPDLVGPHRAEERPGLQLADVVASAFFKAVDLHHTGTADDQFALALAPRMARSIGDGTPRIAGYGVKLMPSYRRAKLRPGQEVLFRRYGYPMEWRDRRPTNTRLAWSGSE